MKEIKSIERLFQEKFKDFEATPPLESWNNIEARLNKKEKKRRIIPFWFKSTGIAASLAIAFFLLMNKGSDSNLIKNDSKIINSNPVSNVEVEPENNTFQTKSNEENTIKNDNLLDEELFLNDDEDLVLENNIINQNDKSTQNSINNKNNSFNKRVVSIKKQKTNKPSVNSNERFNNQGLAVKNKTQNKTNSKNGKNLLVDQDTNQGLAVNNKTQNKSNSKNVKELLVDQDINQGLVTNNNLNIDNSKELFTNQNSNSSIGNHLVLNDTEEKKALIDKSKLELLNSNNGLNNEVVISENSSGIKKTDTLLIENENIIANAIEDSILLASVETEENPLEKLLKEKLEGKNVDEKEKEKRNKWAVSTVASPVYFNSVSNGSSLDSKLENNTKDYVSSLSFGVGLEYAVSKKWSIKAGINTLSLDYNTNDVVFFQDVNARMMEHITPTQTGSMLTVQSKNATSQSSINVSGTLVQKFDGQINQKMGYVEVPLELSYKLIDKKFGINIIGGMSTLFLNENNVSLVSSNGSEINIGEANNLNNIHFSSNVGLGFKYTFWKSFQANFQPMFKYQINTFSNDSGNFKPYFVGLYSGISFSF
ncbi:hypothetical protein [Flavobacterium sp.]|jgi:hypothetical protein|uniref:hypothetical protein n=1 Tax=Flavobacterium sp. TaxID=239 RepID=UPI002A830BC3|nr:hypothetical protein [Flavobacterium sp.]